MGAGSSHSTSVRASSFPFAASRIYSEFSERKATFSESGEKTGADAPLVTPRSSFFMCFSFPVSVSHTHTYPNSLNWQAAQRPSGDMP